MRLRAELQVETLPERAFSSAIRKGLFVMKSELAGNVKQPLGQFPLSSFGKPCGTEESCSTLPNSILGTSPAGFLALLLLPPFELPELSEPP